MGDYLTMEEFERISQKKEEPIKAKSKDDNLTPFMKFGKASYIVFKALWFASGKILKGLYNGLLALNNAIDNARKSETGKAMMKKYEQENKKGFNFMQPPQKQGKKQNKQNPMGWGF